MICPSARKLIPCWTAIALQFADGQLFSALGQHSIFCEFGEVCFLCGLNGFTPIVQHDTNAVSIQVNLCTRQSRVNIRHPTLNNVQGIIHLASLRHIRVVQKRLLYGKELLCGLFLDLGDQFWIVSPQTIIFCGFGNDCSPLLCRSFGQRTLCQAIDLDRFR